MDKNNLVIGYYIALSSVLQVIDSMFPYPFYGVKLGLANVVTLYVLNIIGFTGGIKVALFRPIVASFIQGSFGSPMMLISFVSSVVSTLSMYFIIKIFRKMVSNISVSVVGAVKHNLTQLIIVFLLFVNNTSIFMLLPILIFSGIIFGIITGYFVNFLVKITPKNKEVKLEPVVLSENKSSLVLLEDKIYFIFWLAIFLVVLCILVFIKSLKYILLTSSAVVILKFILPFVQKKFKFSSEDYIFKFPWKGVVLTGIIIIFINFLPLIFHQQSNKGIEEILINTGVALSKLVLFLLVVDSLRKTKYLYHLLYNYPLIIGSLSFTTIIFSKLQKCKSFNIKKILENLVVRDVFVES